MNETGTPPSLTYVRRLHDSVVAMCSSADTKARLLVTIDGAFIAFLTGSMFEERSRLESIVTDFDTLTRVLLILMVVALAGSMITALTCVTPSFRLKEWQSEKLRKHRDEACEATGCPPELLWYCGTISKLHRKDFVASVSSVSESDETAALADQVWVLSEIAFRKHVWVSVGYWLAGATLVLFLLSGVVNVWRTAKPDSGESPAAVVLTSDAAGVHRCA